MSYQRNSIDDETEQISKELFSSLVGLTKSLQSINVDDIPFFKSSVPGFNERISHASTCLSNDAESILKYIGRSSRLLSTGILDNSLRPNDMLENYGYVVEVLDALLEKADIHLDEAKGKYQLGSNIKTAESDDSSKISKKSVEDNVNRRPLSMLRPQLRFEDEIDNSNTPFVPKLKAKLHALKPLTHVSTEMMQHMNSLGLQSHEHPYDYELKHLQYPSTMFAIRHEMEPSSFENTEFSYVETEEQLSAMMQHLNQVSEIAVDTEHHNYRSFQGFICLIQISTRSKDFIIDALALRSSLHCLNQVLTNPNIVKVFHGAESDVQWLQRDFGVYIVNLFDTYHASHALELQQHGLGYLLSSYCSVDTDKKYQLADWRKRPLTEEMLIYARTDTHYLLYIYDRMRNELIEKDPETHNFLRVTLQNSTNTALKKYEKPLYDDENGLGSGGWKNALIKFNSALDLVQLEAFKALHAWRDMIARQEDESVRYVMPNHVLFNLATRIPKDGPGVLACCQPPTPLIRLHATDLASIILQSIHDAERKLEDRNVALLKKMKIPPSILLDSVANGTHTKFEEIQEEDDLAVAPETMHRGVVEFKFEHKNSNKIKASTKESSLLFSRNDNSDFSSQARERALKVRSSLVLIAPSFQEDTTESTLPIVNQEIQTTIIPANKSSIISIVSETKKSKKPSSLSDSQLDALINNEEMQSNSFKRPKLNEEEFNFDSVNMHEDLQTVKKSFNPFAQVEQVGGFKKSNLAKKQEGIMKPLSGNKSMSFH